jgi:hypothetical protein
MEACSCFVRGTQSGFPSRSNAFFRRKEIDFFFWLERLVVEEAFFPFGHLLWKVWLWIFKARSPSGSDTTTLPKPSPSFLLPCLASKQVTDDTKVRFIVEITFIQNSEHCPMHEELWSNVLRTKLEVVKQITKQFGPGRIKITIHPRG